MRDLILLRVSFIAILTLVAFFLIPFGIPQPWSALTGLSLGLLIVFFEARIEQVSLKRLIGAAIASVLGILGAFMIALVLNWALPGNRTTVPFLQLLVLIVMTYVGLAVGSAKGDMLNLAALGGLFGGEKASRQSFKILDTSVVIDGRIALDVVRGADDVTAARRQRFNPLPHLGAHVRRRAERQRLLGADAAPERQTPAVVALYLRDVHAFRLERVQHVQADLHEVGDDRPQRAAAVVGNPEAVRLAHGEDLPERRLDHLAPHLGAHHHDALRADVVAGQEHVDVERTP